MSQRFFIFSVGAILIYFLSIEKGITAVIPKASPLVRKINTTSKEKEKNRRKYFVEPIADNRTLRYSFAGIDFFIAPTIYSTASTKRKLFSFKNRSFVESVFLPPSTINTFTKISLRTIHNPVLSSPISPVIASDIIEPTNVYSTDTSSQSYTLFNNVATPFNAGIMPIVNVNGQNIGGDYSLGSGDSDLYMSNSTVGGDIVLTGAKTMVELTNSRVNGTIRSTDDKSMNITLRNSTINGMNLLSIIVSEGVFDWQNVQVNGTIDIFQKIINSTFDNVRSSNIMKLHGGWNILTIRNSTLERVEMGWGANTVTVRDSNLLDMYFSNTGILDMTNTLLRGNLRGGEISGHQNTFTIADSTIRGNIIFDGISTLNATRVVDIRDIVQNNNKNTQLTLNATRLNNIQLNSPGASSTVSLTNSSRMSAIDIKGTTTFTVTNSTVNGAMNFAGTTRFEANNAILASTFRQNSDANTSIFLSGTSLAPVTLNIPNSTASIKLDGAHINGMLDINGRGLVEVNNGRIHGTINLRDKNDSITLTNNAQVADVAITGGNNTINATNSTMTNITIQGAGNSSLTLTGTTGTSITLGTGRNTVIGSNFTLANNIVLGAGNVGGGVVSLTSSTIRGGITVNDSSTVTLNNSSVVGDVFASSGLARYTITDSIVEGLIRASANSDSLSIINSRVAGINLGASSDTVEGDRATILGNISNRGSGLQRIQLQNSSIGGFIETGPGGDSIVLTNTEASRISSNAGTDTITGSSLRLVGGGITSLANAVITLTNSNINGALAITTRGTVTSTNSTIQGDITAGNANNSASLTTSEANNIRFGNGNNTLALAGSIIRTVTIQEATGNTTSITANNSTTDGITIGVNATNAGTSTATFQNNSRINGNYLVHGRTNTTFNATTVTGLITLNGATTNDTLNMTNATVQNIIIEGGTNIASAINSTTGNIRIKNGSTTLTSTGSTIPSLNIEANANVILNGNANTTTNNSVATVIMEAGTTSFTSDNARTASIQMQGTGTVLIRNNSVATGGVTVTGSGSVTVTNSRVLADITTANGNDTVNMTSSNLRNIVLGTGTKTITANNSTLTSITVGGTSTMNINNNTTVTGAILLQGQSTNTIANSTLEGSITLNSTSATTITNSTLQNDFLGSTQNDTITSSNSTINSIEFRGGNNRITDTNSTIGNLVFNNGTTNTASFTGTTVEDLILTNSTNTITFDTATVEFLSIGNTTTTITATDMTLHEAVATTTRATRSTEITLNGTTLFVGPSYDFGTNSTVNVEGTLSITRLPGSTNTSTTVTGDILNFGTAGTIDLLQGMGSSMLELKFNTMNNSNTNPAFIIHADVMTGDVTRLDISHITNYTGGNNIVQVFPTVSTTVGDPVLRIDEVLISNANIVPTLNTTDIILAGYDYDLTLNPVKANTYDLTRANLSIVNTGFSAAYAGIHSYNASIARSITSHFQEELHMARDREGRKKVHDELGFYSMFNEQNTIIDLKESYATHGFSAWVRAGINKFDQELENSPTLHNTMFSGLFGMDIASIPIGFDSSMMVQFFGAISNISNTFSKIDKPNTTYSVNQSGVSFGTSVGLEFLSLNNRGKFFMNSTGWFSIVNNVLSSNKLSDDNIWNNKTFNGLLSMGYSAYFNRFLITPQAELYYSFIPEQHYLTPDGNRVHFLENHTLIAKANLVLGYRIFYGIAPYIKVGAEVPIMEAQARESITFSGLTLDTAYTATGMNANATAGFSYRQHFTKVSVTFSAEATIKLGKTNSMEALSQIGVAF